MIERAACLRDMAPERYAAIRRVVTLFIVMVGWVLFRSEDISREKEFLGVMFMPVNLPIS